MLADVNRTSKRRMLMFLVNVAQTPEEVRHTRGLVADWLRLHPEDESVKRVRRQLDRSEDRLRQAEELH